MKLVPAEAPAPTSYACPMHPEVTASEPATCPKCGMKLVPADASSPAGSHDGAGQDAHGAHDHGHEHDHGGDTTMATSTTTATASSGRT